MRKNIAYILSFVLSAVTVLSCGCSNNDPTKVDEKDNLLNTVQKSSSAPSYDFTDNTVQPSGYSSFIEASGNLCVSMLKELASQEENTIASPAALSLSLANLNNGSKSSTQKQLSKAVGGTNLTVENANNCSAYLTQRLTAFNDDKNNFSLLNSMWVSNDINVMRGFLQKNENFYNIPTYKADFNDKNTAKKINNLNADLSKNIVTDSSANPSSDASLYMVSSASIQSSWISAYNENNIKKGTFNTLKGDNPSVDFLVSNERYLNTDNATGFIKNLETVPCKFIALLPDENVSLLDLADSLNATSLTDLINKSSATDFATVSVPKFSVSYEADIKGFLTDNGVDSIFTDKAELGKLSGDETYVNDIYSKTVFTLDENGICTNNTPSEKGSEIKELEKSVKFDKPFIFIIADNESGIPLMVGTVTNPSL